jgi:hypothetical protein
MSFLKEIDQYMDSIRKALSHGSRIDINNIKEINRIYDDLRVEESVTIYGRQKSLNDLPRVDLSCGQCVKSMFEQIVIWHNKKSQPIVEFKGVPQKEIVDDSDEDEAVRPDQLSWGEFKRYCSEQGLRVKGKSKAALLQELDEIS